MTLQQSPVFQYALHPIFIVISYGKNYSRVRESLEYFLVPKGWWKVGYCINTFIHGHEIRRLFSTKYSKPFANVQVEMFWIIVNFVTKDSQGISHGCIVPVLGRPAHISFMFFYHSCMYESRHATRSRLSRKSTAIFDLTLLEIGTTRAMFPRYVT